MAIKESVTLEDVAEFLNELLKVDYDTINKLFSIRMACNGELADHPTVQVLQVGGNKTNPYFVVGIIGLLNGLFGTTEHGWGRLCVNAEKDKILSFSVLSDEDIDKYTGKKED